MCGQQEWDSVPSHPWGLVWLRGANWWCALYPCLAASSMAYSAAPLCILIIFAYSESKNSGDLQLTQVPRRFFKTCWVNILGSEEDFLFPLCSTQFFFEELGGQARRCQNGGGGWMGCMLMCMQHFFKKAEHLGTIFRFFFSLGQAWWYFTLRPSFSPLQFYWTEQRAYVCTHCTDIGSVWIECMKIRDEDSKCSPAPFSIDLVARWSLSRKSYLTALNTWVSDYLLWWLCKVWRGDPHKHEDIRWTCLALWLVVVPWCTSLNMSICLSYFAYLDWIGLNMNIIQYRAQS